MVEDLIGLPSNLIELPVKEPFTVAGTASATSTLLLLVDGRLPTGAHAHSGGIEPAVADRRIHDVATLGAFLEGKLETTGLVDAAFAAAVVQERAPLDDLNGEAIARCPSPALRRASAAQGRGLLRVAHRIWPSDELDRLASIRSRSGALWPIVLGTVARAAGISSGDAALAAAQAATSGPAWAAVRLLGLDPYEVVALLGALALSIDLVARRANFLAQCVASIDALPAVTGPLLEIAAEHHAQWEVRLFVS